MKSSNKISKIPFPNDTIYRKIIDLSAHIEKNVLNSRTQNLLYMLTNELIRFIDGDQIIKQFFSCEEMPLTVRCQVTFDILSACLEKWNLSGNSCIGICTDGAPSTIGYY